MLDLGTSFLASTEKNPDALAIAGNDYKYTYSEWFSKIDKLAGSLKSLGLKKKDKIIILFESKSFLQKQIRSMVGCLKYVGEKKWKPEKIKSVIKLKKRELCAPPAPPEGLYLEKVFY